ncbi:probable histone-lysine N-methyltransferase PRDM7 [Manduca sexta]|uniref:probable histone-lysine N-methyltransferase PRDM7 n=1 Tax=Manduca sexta TaxID=7130 RepID=UPI00188E995E|nr:probable histone-lysine N-methyltransferase PRDM7 [Manduca sexta]
MSKMKLRQKQRISYYEPDEPNLDEYVFCDKCADFVYEYCAIHGPLLVIPDDKVSSKPKYPSFVPRAALTIPSVFLHLAPSRIPGAGLGVFSTLTIPRGVRFGPYRGKRTDQIRSMYCWQVLEYMLMD